MSDEKRIQKQFTFVEALFEKLRDNVGGHLKNKNDAISYGMDDNYMNKNTGKTSIQRQIMFLRNELINLSNLFE